MNRILGSIIHTRRLNRHLMNIERMNSAMIGGMLYEVRKTEVSCGRILSALNSGLYPRMEKQTLACCCKETLIDQSGTLS